MKKHKKSLQKKMFVFLGVLIVLTLGFQIIRAATYNFQGFMWVGNNSYADRIEGDATVGMVSLRGRTADNQDYGVTLSESADAGLTRLLIGDAWMGIGGSNDQFKNFKDQTDSPSIGWIRFNQGVPPSSCFGAGDCYAARWNKKTGTAEGSLEGYISGWAKMLIGKEGDGSNYPDVWVHFKAPSNLTNYTCDLVNDKHNYVCVDNNGRLSGFAWSSGADSTSFSTNPGFGWIGFNRDREGQSLAFLSTSSSSADLSRFCSTRLTSDSDMVCKNVGDTSKSFNFASYFQDSSISVSSTNRDNHFRWKCKGEPSEAYTYGENVTCSYTQAGTFIPTLEIEDSSTGWISCANQAVANIVDKSECLVLVRKADSTSEDEFLQEITLKKDDLAEAKIVRKCLPSGSPSWTTNGTINFTGSDTIKISLSSVSPTTVSATIGATTCSMAQINTKDYLEWR